jgi:peptide/nickel transport system ATP-binding protein
MKTLLEVENLEVKFNMGTLQGKPQNVHAVDGINFSIPEGRTLGIVGESGCGKSTTALAIMRLLKPSGGSIFLNGQNLTALAGEELRKRRKDFQIIFQDPYSALNPRQRVGSLIRTPMDLLEVGKPSERDARVDELLALVGLRPEFRHLFPHQFSGGQRQRIGIARALATSPALIVCDEPVSALDVAIQAQILNLMKDLQTKLNLAFLFISHDIGVVSFLCHETAVMYLGVFVEQGVTREIISKPSHPYTRILLGSIPRIDPENRDLLKARKLPGDPPSPINPQFGCRFASRCPYAQDKCRQEIPELRPVEISASRRLVACHYAEQIENSPEPETLFE